MFEFLGWLVFCVLVTVALAAVGIAALGRRAGKDFSQQLREIRKVLGINNNRSTNSTAELTKSNADVTKAELYEDAKDADIKGRSTMSKDELKAALDEESSGTPL